MRWLWLLVLAVGCTTTEDGIEAGRKRFNDPQGFSRSEFNTFSCATCHSVKPGGEPDRLDTGATMYGAAARMTWWGGNEIRLIDAVNACLTYFMRADALDETSDAARELYEYLESLAPAGAPSDPIPFTIVENIEPIPQGDATRGQELYVQACQLCHGTVHTGAGQIIEPMPYVLPEFTDQYDTIFPGVAHGLVVIEKIRHGRFFNVGGSMAPYTAETMTDAQIGDLLAFLGLSSGE